MPSVTFLGGPMAAEVTSDYEPDGLTTVLLEHEVFAGDHVRPSDAKPDHVIGQLDEVLALGDRVAVMHSGELTDALPALEWTREEIGLAMAGAA